MYMIGFVDQKTKPIGELECQAMMSKELMKQELRNMCRQISQSQETSWRTPSTNAVNMQFGHRNDVQFSLYVTNGKQEDSKACHWRLFGCFLLRVLFLEDYSGCRRD